MAAVAPVAGAGAPAPAPGGDGQQPQQGGFSIMSIARMLLFYWVISSFFKGGSKTPAPTTDVAGVTHQPHRPMWRENTPFDMYVYVHHAADLNVNQFTASQLNPSRLVWRESNLLFGSWDASQERALNWTFTDESWMMAHLQANGTLYAHVFFVRDRSPLFRWRAKHEREEAVVWDAPPDAIVVGADGGSTSYALAHGLVDLTPIPSPDSPQFRETYVQNARWTPKNIIHRTMELNIYRPAPKVVDKKNLLGVGGKANTSTEVAIKEKTEEDELAPETDEEDEEMEGIADWLDDEEDANQVASTKGSKSSSKVAKPSKKQKKGKVVPYLSYWKPFLSIRPIPDFTVFPYRGIPEPMVHGYVIDSATEQYEPLIYFDYFWLLNDQLTIINNTVSQLSLNLTTSPLSLLKWSMEQQMEVSWKMQQSWGMQEEGGREVEMFKKMVMDTNIYLLALTFFVSILHSIFDFLAFKNDVAFWKNAKSMRGLSTRSILMNAVCQAIIFLYLLDQDTSYMILVSSGIGVAIEFWKVSRALVITIDRTRPFPWIRIQNKNMSEDKREEDKTEEEKEIELHAKYDSEAMTYLSYVCYPLVVGYAIYSLYYDTHKSWYSFILATLTGCVYTGGFIMMTPQLYLNYKLKSVAHLPWRMLTYKALNTFIDDLFSFIITMPTLHRLACFRDDIIFFIFLYQKWIYRVDYTRVNEFGTVLVSEEEQARMVAEDRAKALAAEAKEAAQHGAAIEEIKDDEPTEKASAKDAALEETTAEPEATTAEAEPATEAELRHRKALNNVD